MALQTPTPRSGLQRPSFGTTASSPSLRASATAASRKQSLQALTGQLRTTPSKMDDADLQIGDSVNVPGDMYGTVKFIGSVRGKNGRFVGVELDREFAARGKNDGDVDGIHYFTTTIPGAGIFLPVHRAEKKYSPGVSLDSFPATPGTPSAMNGFGPGMPSKYSQSVGPAGGSASPQFKNRRPSLPRPESPLRRQNPSVGPTPGRNPLASSARGTRSTAGPSKPNLKASTSRPSAAATPQPARPYSRGGSRLGHRSEASIAEERSKTPVGLAKSTSARNDSRASAKSFSQPLRSRSRMESTGGSDEEILRLRAELLERDKRLAEQAANLSDMEASVKELSGLLPTESQLERSSAFREDDDAGTAQLRQMLREKNEKIQILTAEFDTHRADFRSTLDSLEMASSETERVYEEQKQDLIAQVQELTERMRDLEEMNQSKKDFEEVAQQLKQLEDFVQELEEGLEDARRGEAEARGEVEFLRGEVERGRSELRREREKAAAAMNGLSTPKEVEQKEDEIRGLKAIIHSFSTNPNSSHAGAGSALEEVEKLRAALEQSQEEKEKLEHELEQLRRETAATNGHARNESEMTATAGERGARARAGTIRVAGTETGVNGEDSGSKNTESSTIFCEMCESKEHDTLDCAHFQVNATTTDTDGSEEDVNPAASFHKRHPSAAPAPLLPLRTTHKENVDPIAEESSPVKAAEDKWCALCERDGHLAYECPDEQY